MAERSHGSIDEIMDEAKIFSFVVRIWRDEAPIQKHQAAWRGHITLIPNGERQYFSDVRKIPALIATCVKSQR